MNIMDVILDIENKARGIMAESEEICAQQQTSCNKEIDAFRNEIKRSAEMKIAGFQAEQNAAAEKKLEEMSIKYGEKTEELNQKYSENREKWISDIVNRVLGHTEA